MAHQKIKSHHMSGMTVEISTSEGTYISLFWKNNTLCSGRWGSSVSEKHTESLFLALTTQTF